MGKAKPQEGNEDDKPDEGHDSKLSPDDDDLMFEVSVPSTGDVPNKTTIHASQLADDQRMAVECIMQNMKTNLMATITLLPQDMEAAHLVTKFMQSPAAQFQGSQAPKTLKSATSQYVGIFYDVKMSGEASHRPALRMPPPSIREL